MLYVFLKSHCKNNSKITFKKKSTHKKSTHKKKTYYKKKTFFFNFCHKIFIFLNYKNSQVTFFCYNVRNIS